MKKLKYLTLALIFPCMIMLSACSMSDLRSGLELGDVTNITTQEELEETLKGADGKDGKDGQNGLNGKDGVDGDSIDLYEVYTKLIELEEYEGSYAEFVKEYLGTEKEIYSTSKALRSCVSIYSGFSATINYSDIYGSRHQFTSKYYSSGSGVIYSLDKTTGDALIITNYHVIYDYSSNTKISNDINILLYGNNEFSVTTKEYVIDYRTYTQYAYNEFASKYAIQATYLGGSMEYDLAVLKVSNSELLKNEDLLEANFANSNDITVGETAVAIGNAASLGISATTGCVSVDSEYITMTGADNITTCTFRVIRTDSAVNPGNSGGGLFNAKGELIGIVNAKTTSDTIENIGYAIPSNLVKYVVNNIIKNCDGVKNTSVKRCLFGINVIANSSSLVYNEATLKTSIVEEVAVYSVSEDGLAYGLLNAGDIIKSIDIEYLDGSNFSINLTRTFYIVDLSLSLSVGDKVTFNLTNNIGEILPSITIEMTPSCVVVCK